MNDERMAQGGNEERITGETNDKGSFLPRKDTLVKAAAALVLCAGIVFAISTINRQKPDAGNANPDSATLLAEVDATPGDMYQMGLVLKDAQGGGGSGTAVTPGVKVMAILDGSPADQAGVKPGDWVTGLEGVLVNTLEELETCFLTMKKGQAVSFTFQRNTHEYVLEMIIPAGAESI